MWDVIWTDPDRELVGEHRAKKDDAAKKQKKKNNTHSGRTSVSTTTTSSRSSSSMDIPLSIFRTNRGLKRTNNAAGHQMAALSISSSGGIESPLSPVATAAAAAASTICTRSPLSRSTFDDGSSDKQSSDRASASIFERQLDSPLSASPALLKKADSACNISPSPSNNESIFSILPADVSANSSIDHGPMTDSEKIKSIIQLLEHSDLLTTSAETSRYPETNEPRKNDDAPAAPLTPPRSPSHPILKPPSRMKLDIAFSPTTLVPPLKSPFRVTAPKWHIPLTPNNPDAWKLPGHGGDPTPISPQYKTSDEILNNPSLPEILNLESEPDNKEMVAMTPPSFDLLREQVVKMASADVKEMLSRLYELWDKIKGMEPRNLVGGTSENVLEMRRWMLSAMSHIDLPVSTKKKPCAQPSTTARMVLVLYEPSITVTYLAALDPSKQFYDMSTSTTTTTTTSSSNSISFYDKFDSIRHISISSISPTDFPVAPRIFEAVISHSLPSQCPWPLLPGILKAVHRSLKPGGGALLLTLIDPLPRAGTMGPRMRAWIESNLLHNLARQSRCMSPSTYFPRILGQVKLRGKGSTLTTTKFYALPQSATRRKLKDPDDDDDVYDDTDPEMKTRQQESEVKAQVRSLVGRMLWAQVWGPHVTAASKWWWEDEACVQECLQLGTFWEYHTIRAVKTET